MTGVVGVLLLVALGIGFFVHAAGAHSDTAHTTSPAATSFPVGTTGSAPSPSTSASIPAAHTPTTSNVQSTSTTHPPQTTSTTNPQTPSTTPPPTTSTTDLHRATTTTVPPTVLPTTTAPPLSASPAAPAGQICHAQGSGDEVLPDPSCTPGTTDPRVTQANIVSTICRSGWTGSVRPPESVTDGLKLKQMAAYGYGGQSPKGFEEDHLIPLELGGSPTSPQNLWPEVGASPNPKDAVESAANHAVCDGQMPLATAQQEIASNWIALGHQLGVN